MFWLFLWRQGSAAASPRAECWQWLSSEKAGRHVNDHRFLIRRSQFSVACWSLDFRNKVSTWRYCELSTRCFQKASGFDTVFCSNILRTLFEYSYQFWPNPYPNIRGCLLQYLLENKRGFNLIVTSVLAVLVLWISSAKLGTQILMLLLYEAFSILLVFILVFFTFVSAILMFFVVLFSNLSKTCQYNIN